jgi:biopolymer transport protein ExbD
MAEIIQNEGGGKKKGKKRAKKLSTHIDMTPMVDLFCLLLTFFMLTTAFSKPKVMEIVLPEKDVNIKDRPKIQDERVVNVILDENDRVFWYNGMVDPKKTLPTLTETNFSKDGIRKVLLNRNKTLFESIYAFEDSIKTGKIVLPRDTADRKMKKMRTADKVGPIVLIKATDKVKYGNIVNIIDEMAITNVARYSIVDINDIEKKMIEDYKKTNGK